MWWDGIIVLQNYEEDAMCPEDAQATNHLPISISIGLSASIGSYTN